MPDGCRDGLTDFVQLMHNNVDDGFAAKTLRSDRMFYGSTLANSMTPWTKACNCESRSITNDVSAIDRYIFGSAFFLLSKFITPTKDNELRSGIIEAGPQINFRAC